MFDEQKNFYNENGYVILEKIFSDEEAEFFNKCVRRHANNSFAALINPDRYESLLEQDERPKSDITLSEIEETASLARSIMTDGRMVELLDIFHDESTVGLSSQFIFKEAFSDYSSQAWKPHQDNFYPKSKNSAYITLNWFLKDADRDNGTIYCYPGSHKLGLLPAENNVSFREKIGDNPGRKEPSTGEINYKNIFKYIHDKGFDGVLGMEHGNSKPNKQGEIDVIKAYKQVDNFLI